MTYAQAPAEALSLPDGVLDVLTVAQAFHWFGRAAFLAEARRTLKPGSVLALYDVEGQPDFGAFAESYIARYPTPPRHRELFGEAKARAAGFSFHEERWKHPLALTRSQLVSYLLTHSNPLAATDSGAATSDEIAAWLNGQLAPLYAGSETRNVGYGAMLTVLRRP